MASPSPQKHPQKVPGRISVECPHCAARQNESVFAKTTFCRKCGEHFDLEAKHLPVPTSTDEPSLLSRITRIFQREKIRTIHCFDCKGTQQISSFAKSSFCTHCGGYIDLRDFKILGNFSRSVQTQGFVDIGPKGDVTSSKIGCANGMLRGKLHGNLLCTGTLQVKTKNKVLGGIDAENLVIEKRSDVEFVRTIKAVSVEIKGKISARITADRVKITKSGILEGTVYAKSNIVDKGGIFRGELVIGRTEPDQQEELKI